MDGALSREESIKLMQLLGLPMQMYGHIPVMRKAFLQKSKEYHPDKGGDEETFKTLCGLYRKLENSLRSQTDFEKAWEENAEGSWSTSDIPPYGTDDWERWWESFNQSWDDLRCDETLEPSDEEDNTQDSTPPKKKRPSAPEFPDVVEAFLSKALISNRTHNKFAILTNKEKSCSLYKKVQDKYAPIFVSRHTYEVGAIILLLTSGKHRTSAIQNFCQKYCTYSTLCCRAVLNDKGLYEVLCNEPFEKSEETVEGGLFNDQEKEPVVSWVKIQDYALENKIEDVLLLMGLYLELAKPVANCMDCLEEQIITHYKYHKGHHENAKLFRECKSQKNICQQAIDGVIARRRMQLVTLKREELLVLRFKDLFMKMEAIFGPKGNGDLKTYMAGAAWLHCLLPKFEEEMYGIIKGLTLNAPKKRYFLFQGPINSGKTTVAAALLDLLGGKALNINQPKEKLNFELGVAIDQFMVVFEDVKGDQSTVELPKGCGVGNLDDLRDYMDGCVKVNLEKKHLNKRTQIFPPGIVTMNQYILPPTLRCRFVKKLVFRAKNYLANSIEKSPYLLFDRILSNGITLILLLMYYLPVAEFDPQIQTDVCKWKERIDVEVGDPLYRCFLSRVAQGEDICGFGDEGQDDSRAGESSSECSHEDSATLRASEASQTSGMSQDSGFSGGTENTPQTQSNT
uniref:Large T antigen n=1 Tax=Meles meles polyomavirus 1 TaxID=1608323 RepID=A0A0B5LB63_9POLY|nr:large T antigen [Meles meles polyomavirus 1]